MVLMLMFVQSYIWYKYHIFILSGLYDYSPLGEIIYHCTPACKNLVLEFKHQNKYWNTKRKRKERE